MKPYYQDEWVTIYHGDCREILPQLPKVDLVLTDPPYGVDYAEWDEGVDGELIGLCLALGTSVVMFGGALPKSMKLFLPYEPDRCIIWNPNFILTCNKSNGLMWRWHPIWCWNLPKEMPFDRDILTDNCEGHHWWNHPATKPEPLISKLVMIGQNTILDPFLGSGTTAYCAKKLNRKCIGIEIEEKYCEISANRCRQMVFDLTPLMGKESK